MEIIENPVWDSNSIIEQQIQAFEDLLPLKFQTTIGYIPIV